ncbi:carbohydrate ABC transporter permease [Streptomyces griseorubiginosus]|uniref:carbohydrate ABC transporter permease n=1 Tax=Streptomyces griseorubiginosus TaxID=67304 RepID=UPI0036750210
MSHIRTARRGSGRMLVLFAGPAVLIFLVFVVYPLVGTMAQGFFSDRSGATTFVGFANFVDVLTGDVQGPRFWNAFVNNIEFFLIHLVVELPLALLYAALLTSGRVRRLVGVYRTLLFIPTTLSVVIVAYIWRMIINPLWGLVDFPLLADESTALPTVALMSVWQYVGIPMIFLYSALIAIPHELVEASRLDGAGAWRIFWSIKFPLIAPQFGIISILTFIATFNGFDIIYASAGATAGPNYSTDILGTYFFRTYFGAGASAPDTYLGAAVAGLIFTILLIGTAIYFWFVQRRLTTHEL